MDKVSIIIPVYNAEKYIINTLKSVLNQTYEAIEIIVVNDGSIDNSLVLLQQFVKKYKSKVKVIDILNGGPGLARNNGIDNATGEYITFVDSDDTIEKEMIQVMVNRIKSFHGDICICGMSFIKNKVRRKYEVEDGDISLHKYLISDVMASPCNKLYKRELFNNIRFDEELSFEDLEIVPKLCLKANRLVGVKQCFYNYYQRENTRNTISEKSALQVIEVLKNILKFYKEEKKFEEYYKELEYISLYHTLGSKVVGISTLKDEKKRNNILNAYKEFLDDNFNGWRKNKYIRCMSIKYKLIFFLVNHKFYALLHRILMFK